MNDDIFESVSQRGSGEETAENGRIHEVANELLRRCQLYEAQLRDGQGNVRIRGRLDPKATLRAEDRRRTPRELKWME